LIDIESGRGPNQAAILAFSHRTYITRSNPHRRNDATALAFVFGGSSEATYTKSLALMYHLFGAELQHVLMVVLPKGVHLVAASEETAQVLRAMYEGKAGDGDAEVRTYVRAGMMDHLTDQTAQPSPAQSTTQPQPAD